MLKADLRELNRSIFCFVKISDKKQEIESLDAFDDAFGLDVEEMILRKKCTAELLRHLHWKEGILHQKAMTNWILEGDSNSKLFHSWINRYNKLNELDVLLVQNMWTNSVDGVQNDVLRHFRSHFGSNTATCISPPTNFFCKKVDELDNHFLEAPFFEDEIKETIRSYKSSKSPCPDGFSFGFIKANCANMKSEVMQMLQEFHNNGKFVRGFNSSFIVLVPKKDQCQSLDDYRSISLVGYLYKIISKTLATRLSKVLESVISLT